MMIHTDVLTLGSALAGGLHWIEGILLGSIGTTIAILTIASVGFLMLTGRLPYRRGATVILGCFILFGASAIAAGIVGNLGGSKPSPPAAIAGPSYIPANPKPASRDPNAGASVPNQRSRDMIQ